MSVEQIARLLAKRERERTRRGEQLDRVPQRSHVAPVQKPQGVTLHPMGNPLAGEYGFKLKRRF